MAKAKAGKGRRSKQGELPGYERPRDEEIEAAAEDVDAANGKWSKAASEREDASARLIALMKKKGITEYKSEDLKLRISLVTSASEKVKVTKLEVQHADVDEAAE